jgi:hypothetical protein
MARLYGGVCVLGLLGASALAFKFIPAPFVWIPLGWGIVLIAWGFRRRGKAVGVVAINFAYISLALAGVEAWFQVDEYGQVGVVKTYDLRYQERHPFLGSRPKPSVVEHATATYADELIYDVEYTIGEDGLRLAPPAADPAADCVLFFGGSFMYGEGLDDEEALPYQVGVQSGGRARVFNFGFHGHGASQMLSALEHGYVDDAIDCLPTHAVYLAIDSHVERLLPGGWRSFAPRYVRDGAGGVVFRGLLRDAAPVNWFTTTIEPRLRKSKLVSRILDYSRPPGEETFDLYIDLVAQAAETQRDRYPGIEVHMLVWDDWDEGEPGIGELTELTGDLDGIHRASAILPGFTDSTQQYRIHSRDWHPNALANRLLAGYVVENILAPAPHSSSADTSASMSEESL